MTTTAMARRSSEPGPVDGERQHASDEGEGGHEDGTEPVAVALEDGVEAAHALVPQVVHVVDGFGNVVHLDAEVGGALAVHRHPQLGLVKLERGCPTCNAGLQLFHRTGADVAAVAAREQFERALAAGLASAESPVQALHGALADLASGGSRGCWEAERGRRPGGLGREDSASQPLAMRLARECGALPLPRRDPLLDQSHQGCKDEP